MPCSRRPTIRPRLLPALAALLAAPAAARTATDEQLWINTTVQGGIAGDYLYFVEWQPRFGDGISDVDQLLARGGVGRRLSPSVSVWQGYAHVETPRDAGGPIKEDRSFQQVSWSMGRVAGGALSSRTRLEQRWRNDGGDMGWRLRAQLRYRRPLQDRPQPVAALGWVEGFFALNDTDWGGRAGFDRVRGFAGLELPVGRRATVEAGYLNQTIDNPRGGTTVHHVASVSLFLRH